MKNQLISDIIQWDINSWSEALNYWDKNVNWSNIHNGLELGGREGGLSLWLALKGINTVCSDLHNVKESAAPLHQKYNVSTLITYEDIDATKIPYENHFDVIVFKSIIGGIGRNNNIEMQKKTFKEIYKALKPGGKLLFAENLTASPIHQQLRRRFVRWGGEWRYVTISEMKIFLKDFSRYEIKTTGFLSVFGRTENQRKLFSVVDKILLNHVSPDSWKYIIYGVAEK